MDFLNNSEPIRIKKRDGTPKNPFIHITEEITVYNNMFVFSINVIVCSRNICKDCKYFCFILTFH